MAKYLKGFGIALGIVALLIIAIGSYGMDNPETPKAAVTETGLDGRPGTETAITAVLT